MASRIKEGIKELFSNKDDDDYRSSYQQQRILSSQYGHNTAVPVLELKVPMCCDKCQEKVMEALEECDGVEDVICDQYNQRVTVTGFVDPMKALRKVKKVKKKSEFFNDGTYIKRTSHPIDNGAQNFHSRSVHLPVNGNVKSRYTSNPLIRTHSNGFGRFPHEGKMAAMAHIVHAPPPATYQARPLVRSNSYGRRVMSRQPAYHDRREMSRHSTFGDSRDSALVPVNFQRDFQSIRRMPSFKHYHNHDAEYISMGDEFRPAMAETHYAPLRSQRPGILRPQVSFSRLPVTNPHYMKHIESEYY